MPRLRYDENDLEDESDRWIEWLRHERHARPERRSRRRQKPMFGRSPRTAADQAFKCGRCRAFIGAPATGGRHRNHCPMCLHSRHVDGNRPGDRRGDCGSLMAPVGVVQRRNGEQIILHRCLGCGRERPNRVAADDNPVLLLRLPPVAPAGSVPDGAANEEDEAIA